ncbi:glycosyltransferase family 2 protein [Segatella baroniae]|uniref:glycosyltransferase family 2 protein n=1 Tax=Segatella baroniae TaxID=305719 RepID=UPI000420BEC9|nr:glycosyltransferase family 2 protein [Segatella baroniae]
MTQLIAGIVLYNPDISKLKKNINAILPLVTELLLVDNCSRNISQIKSLYSSDQRIKIIDLQENFGIAKAQNIICKEAKKKKYEWALILDQDSVVPDNIISEYKESIIRNPFAAMICPRIFDRNFGEINNYFDKIEESINYCIASATLLKISAWEKVGGFCEEMFIDSVDFDICYSLKELGYFIIRNNNVILLHEVGHSNIVHYLGKDYQIFNHSPLRYYYIIRNSIYLGRRHNCLSKWLLVNFRIWFQVNFYEKNRLRKNKMILLGFFHGIMGKYGKLNYDN